ncbi:MAG TPA: pseudouridine synthase [Terriglobia bacterium]|nr:pseudouridine synthase [Terriglobia bacterium]
MLERLQKIIASAGVTSRRKAEELIQQGRVTVNGQTVTELGSKADAGRDQIRVDGSPLRSNRNLSYVLVNKPVGYVSTVSDPQHRPTVVSLVRNVKARLYPVGRLDYHSSGIILLTNDGDLANFMMARASAVPRTYHVKLEESADPEALRKLEQGIVLDGQRTAPARIRPLSARSERDKPWYEITLVEGRYHQVRRMFERIGRPVVKLKRVRIAFLTDEGLAPGRFRHLASREVERLKKLSARRPAKTHASQ